MFDDTEKMVHVLTLLARRLGKCGSDEDCWVKEELNENDSWFQCRLCNKRFFSSDATIFDFIQQTRDDMLAHLKEHNLLPFI